MCSCKQIFSLHEGMNDDSNTKGGIVNISHDYNVGEKWAMTAHVRGAVHANFKDIFREQETIKERELSQKSIINSGKGVLKIIGTIKEYENPFAFSSTRKSKLKSIVTESVVGSEHLNDILEARAIGK